MANVMWDVSVELGGGDGGDGGGGAVVCSNATSPIPSIPTSSYLSPLELVLAPAIVAAGGGTARWRYSQGV